MSTNYQDDMLAYKEAIKILERKKIALNNQKNALEAHYRNIFNSKAYKLYRIVIKPIRACRRFGRRIGKVLKFSKSKKVEEASTKIEALCNMQSVTAVVAYAKTRQEVHAVVHSYLAQSCDRTLTLHMFISYYEGYEQEFNQFNGNGIYTHPVSYIHELIQVSDLICADNIIVMHPDGVYDSGYVDKFLQAYQSIQHSGALAQSAVHASACMCSLEEFTPEVLRSLLVHNEFLLNYTLLDISDSGD